MVFFVSDLHYDHRPPPDDPLLTGGDHAERELVACLQHHRDRLTHVVLLGDLFDAWIEYRDLVPKGLTRLFGLLAMWSDEGLDVTVVAGNHDPWHRDYLEKHLGFRLLRASTIETMEGATVAFGHGDQEKRRGLSKWQAFIRSRPIHTLYAEVLPGSFGLWLARMWSRGARSSRLDSNIVGSLQRRGVNVLEAGKADVVIYGHCHAPAHHRIGQGSYLNTGSWALHRSFVTLEGGQTQPFGEIGANRNRTNPGTPKLWQWTADGPRQFAQESAEAKLEAV